MGDDLIRLAELLEEGNAIIERIGTDTHAMANASDRLLEAAMWLAIAIEEGECDGAT